MKPTFREDKAVQAAALFLKLRRNDNKMSHLKLMKLLYLAEREALLRWGRPIMYDSCVSMDHGPVLSQTLNLVNGDIRLEGLWERFISSPEHHEVTLIEDPGDDRLSDAEERLIREIFAVHGAKSRWEVRDFTHTLGEWQDPKGSSIGIDYQEILRAGNKGDSEIASILEDIESLAIAEKFSGGE